ncbi:MAG: hypothetical protein QGH97_12620, partial [Dehalococcoidia bacterium]|nr:hypothetical protein [Dehalococcoidia bacterium]
MRAWVEKLNEAMVMSQHTWIMFPISIHTPRTAAMVGFMERKRRPRVRGRPTICRVSWTRWGSRRSLRGASEVMSRPPQPP